jgi:hypothetical protein
LAFSGAGPPHPQMSSKKKAARANNARYFTVLLLSYLRQKIYFKKNLITAAGVDNRGGRKRPR